MDSFDEGAINLVTAGVNNVLYGPTKRYINCAEMNLTGPNGKQVVVRITLITEPIVFDETVFPTESERYFTTSAVEQLEQMERANERVIQ